MNDTPRIAIVDDHVSVLRAVARMVRTENMAPETYSCARTFLESLVNGISQPPDCLVLDLQMPQMTGIQLQQELSIRGFRFPIVIITGDDSLSLHQEAFSLGAFALVKKPFNDAVFNAAIKSALTQRMS